MLKLVDAFTVATCQPTLSTDHSKVTDPLVMEPFSCAVQAEKERCDKGGGTCVMSRDGYHMVNLLCVVFGLATFAWYIKPRVLRLQGLPLRAWRLSGPGKQ